MLAPRSLNKAPLRFETLLALTAGLTAQSVQLCLGLLAMLSTRTLRFGVSSRRAHLVHVLLCTVPVPGYSQVLDAYQDVMAPHTKPRPTSNAQAPPASFDWEDSSAPVVAERTTSHYTAHARVDELPGAAAVARRADRRTVSATTAPHMSHHEDVLKVDPAATHHLLTTKPADASHLRDDDTRLDWSDGVQATLVSSSRQLHLRGLPPQPKPDWPEPGPRWLSQPEPQAPAPSGLRGLRPVSVGAPTKMLEQADEWGHTS